MFALSGKPLLFVSTGRGENTNSALHQLLRRLKRKYPAITSWVRVRMSVIALWTAEKNIRQAQYWAGHHSVARTELYKRTGMGALKEQITKYHPLR